MIRYFFRQYWRYFAMGLALATISFLLGSCDVKAETLECDAGLKLNGTNVTKSSTTTLASGTNYTLQMVAPGVIGNDVYIDGQYYTDFTVVTNIAFGNYTGTYGNSAFSILNLNYTSNALGFGTNDGVWRIRVLWTANDDIERADDLLHVLSPSLYNYGGSVNYLGGMRLIDITCGEQASMPTNQESDAALLQSFQNLQTAINNQNTQINGNLNDIENAINGGNAINRQYQQATTDAINNGTQQQIESQQVCTYYDIKQANLRGYINNQGQYVAETSGGSFSSEYIKITDKDKITLATTTTNNYRICFYNTNKTLISCLIVKDLELNYQIQIPTNSSYFRYALQNTSNAPSYKICKNGNQATNDSINDLNDSINNSDIDDPTSILTDMDDEIASNSVISDLLLLPVNMFQKIVNSINGTCSTFNLGSLWGSNLSMPCINIQNIIGSNLWAVVDVLFCGIFVLSIRKKFVDIFENITSLKDRGNELE